MCKRVFAVKLSKRYGGNLVFRDVSFEVLRGEVLAVYGPNGSGKTTLLRIVSLLTPFDEGMLHVCGVEVRGGEPVRRFYRFRGVLVGYASQTPEVIGDLSVLENVAIGALRRVGSWRLALEAGIRALELLGLERFAERKAGELSGGLRKRVEIARLVAADPPVMCLDEPLAHLDRDGRELILHLLEELRRRGKVVIVATPGEPELLREADRVLRLG